MNKIIPDQADRDRALDPTQSFIVQAPAGSGKTELLTQRFLTLLCYVQAPEEILAITFTKKSANEMRNRIINTLKKAHHSNEKTGALAQKVLARDKQLQWNILSNSNRLRIQTIDAFNVKLTKHLPIVSQFGAAPDITQDPISLYREAVQEFLSHLEENVAWSKAIGELLLHNDNDLNKLEKLLITLLTKRDQWLPHLATSHIDLRDQLENCLQKIIHQHLDTIENLFPKALNNEIEALRDYANFNLQKKTSTDPFLRYQDIASLLLTNENQWRKAFTVKNGFPADKNPEAIQFKERIITVVNQFLPQEKLRQAFAELRLLPDAGYSDLQWKIIDSLQLVLKVVVAQLKLTFQKYGQIDYIENAQAALTALGSDDAPTDIALALDYRIQHILVDEFQDTANTQYRLLEKLTAGWQHQDGRTLFVVGDPMQSIYRFREAEVGLFIRSRKQGLGQVHLEPLTLKVNFRSEAELVNWYNEHFQQIFPKEDDIKTGSVSYSPSAAIHAEKNASDIQLHAFFQNENQNEQANKIIGLIQESKTKHPSHSIAILVRNRSHLRNIIPALKAANLPYRAIDIDPLSLRPAIQDLISLTLALINPTDRIAWLSILRAPWCGLTLDDLFLLTDKKSSHSLFENLQDEMLIQTLSEDGKTRIQRIFPLLKQAVFNRARDSLRSWIENTWEKLGGPACVNQESDLMDAESFFKLLESISLNQSYVNREMLERLVETLYATPDIHSNSQLQIMTIHNAKGLEFDTVILPHLERKPAIDDKQLLLWMERPNETNISDLLIAPMNAVGSDNDKIYDYIRRQINQKMKYETGRLFYVAVTRAKQNLHLLFSLTENERTPDSSSLLGQLWPAIKNKIILPEKSNSSVETVKPIKYNKRLKTHWQLPLLKHPTAEISFHQNQSGFTLVDNKPQLLGTCMHAILQQLARAGISWWQSQDPLIRKKYLIAQLQNKGMLNSEIEQASDVLFMGIQNILNDERGRWILKNHQEAHAEYPLTAVIENKLMSLVIDRTFIDEHGVRWIIDYKTTVYNSSDLENFLIENQKKYSKQLNQYKEAFQKLDQRPIKLGLYFPLIPAWNEC